jgi:glycerol-3-phosphate acyltransferase PlsY
MTACLLAAAAAYLIGALPFGVWVARAAGGADPRRAGSASTGATNVARVAGAGAGLATLALDAAKGAAAVTIAQRLAGPEAALCGAVAAVAAVAGHVVPPWPRAAGGKGVATAAGAHAIQAPAAPGVALAVFATLLAWRRYVSLASLGGAASFPLAALLIGSSGPVVAAGLALAGIVLVAHRGNLARLRAGTELRIGGQGKGAGR